MGLLPLAIILGAAPFTIRGYTITADAILVHRLCWATRLPLQGLQSATAEPDAMRGSLRTFGNGGLFSFSGRYWSKHLGAYRALVTDPRRTVVLRYADRTVVLSPETPEQFVRDLPKRSSRTLPTLPRRDPAVDRFNAGDVQIARDRSVRDIIGSFAVSQ